MAFHNFDRLSLRMKATLAVLLILMSALIAVAAAGILQMRSLLAEEETRTVQAVASGIGRAAELSLAVRDERELTRLAERFMHDDEILLIAIYDVHGKLMAMRTRTPELWERYLHNNTAQDNLLLGEQPVAITETSDEFPAEPASPTRPVASAEERTIGRVVVGLSTAPAIEAQQRQTRMTALCTLLAAGFGMVLIYVTVRRWTRRLNRLVLASERIAQGDLTCCIDEHRPDEIGRLSGAYDQMRQAVQQRDAEVRKFNETLQLQVEQRTHSLTEALEAAQAADRAKSRFLATMSHEIRTPLNGIVGMVNLLRGTKLDESQARYAQVARSSADALLSVINDILDFSKIEAGRMELEAVEFDLSATLEDLTETAAQAATRKGLELACLMHPEVAKRAIGDSGRLRQILANLINNAIKFTERGQIVLRAIVLQQETNGMMVRFSVEDTGIGIPEDRRSRLFHSFSQVDASTTRKYGGTGLGLAISKRLAELMGGTIGADSKPGEGSTFWFTARLGIASAAEKTSKVRPPALGDLRQVRVLAVDDSAVGREILAQQLGAWQWEVQTAGNGPAALAIIKEAARAGKPFHLAIIDRQMPNMDGVELAQAIHATDSYGNLPLIMLTNMEDQVHGADLQSMGFAAYMVKPVRQSRLFDIIAQTIGSTWNAASRSESQEEGRAAAPTVGQGGLHVLLAEDNEINQMVASEILANAGLTCDIVENGRLALEATGQKTYDVVLMDCQMPEMDGFEAARKIREREAAAGHKTHVPIVALTANAIKGDRELCLGSGMDGYVTKPINPEQLIEAIHEAVHHGATRS